MDTTLDTIDITAPAASLFSLDLGSNGGVLTPIGIGELEEWIQAERQFWNWVQTVPAGNHRNVIDAGIQCLHNALQHVESVHRHGISSSALQEQLGHIKNYLQDAYINKGLPHSSFTLAERVSA